MYGMLMQKLLYALACLKRVSAFFVNEEVCMEQKAIIMDESAIRRAVARITYEILERNRGAENLCIVGILSRGVVLAERIARKIYELERAEVEFGALDITPFRDDRIADATHSAKSTIHFPVQDKRHTL